MYIEYNDIPFYMDMAYHAFLTKKNTFPQHGSLYSIHLTIPFILHI